MLFFMLQKFPNIKRVVINDINSNLTNAYKTIMDSPNRLVQMLKTIEKEYLSIKDENAKKDFYLQLRKKFNEEILDDLTKTTLLLFLNRTCFNGLYRENSKGEFNVPFGKYENPTICNEEVIYADSELLNRFDVIVLNGDFEKIASSIENNRLSFIYFDPPYRPLDATSSFNSYVKVAFNDEEQIRLGDFLHELDRKVGVYWMLSNADCSAKNSEDRFFETIYGDFYINRVFASRAINSNPTKRGKLTELLICNYLPEEYDMTAAENIAPYNPISLKHAHKRTI